MQTQFLFYKLFFHLKLRFKFQSLLGQVLFYYYMLHQMMLKSKSSDYLLCDK